MAKKRNRKTLIALLFISLGLATPFLFAITAPTLFSTLNISGYQGLDFIYDSVYFKDYWYDSVSSNYPNPNYDIVYPEGFTASAKSFGDRLNFDPDSTNGYLPNLHMEQMGFAIDNEFIGDAYHWTWLDEEASDATYDVYKEFQIQKVKCTWETNLWLDGTAGEAYPDQYRVWNDAEVWVNIQSKGYKYFEDNPNEVYFAPVYIAVSNAEWYSGTDDPNNAKDPSQAGEQDIFPEVRGVAMGIYKEKGGLASSGEDIVDDVLVYEGYKLDPDIFRDDYWIRFGIDRFSADSELVLWGLGGWDYKYPSLHLEFSIHLFVVGEWDVKLYKGDIPDLEPHPVDWEETQWSQFANGLIEFFSSPLGMFLGLTGLALAIFVVLLASGVLTPLIALILPYLIGRKVKKVAG